MKIALIIEHMDPRKGGRETSTAQIAEALAARGHDVTVLCQTGQWNATGVTVRPLGADGPTKATRLKRFAQRVGEVLAAESFDASHAMLPMPGVTIYQPRGGTIPAQIETSRRQRSRPAHWLSMLGRKFNGLRKQIAAWECQVAADTNTICLANSEMVAAEFRRYYGRSEKVVSIFNAVEVPAVDDEQIAEWRQQNRFRLGVSPADTVFVTIATNFELKGIGSAIRALGQWQRSREAGTPKGHLVVIGRDNYESYREFAAMHGVGDQVHFLPPQDNVYPWYSAADACILLSWYDACSRVILEATRWGLPTITTGLNGAAELLAKGTGVIVPRPDSLNEIAAAIGTLADPSQRSQMQAACRETDNYLSMARQIDQLETLYRTGSA